MVHVAIHMHARMQWFRNFCLHNFCLQYEDDDDKIDIDGDEDYEKIDMDGDEDEVEDEEEMVQVDIV